MRLDDVPIPAESPPMPPGYELLRPIGIGGMGKVFLARSASTGELVAIKFIHQNGTGHNGTGQPEISQERFARERSLLFELVHPNIVRAHAHGEVGGRTYFVMEYVEGHTVREMMSPGQPLPMDRVLRILSGVGEALHYLHAQQVIHRDLKPENILVDLQGTTKLSDFGIAVRTDDVGNLTVSGASLGTVNYMSPEQRYGLPIDARADQFSLAVVLFELLTGQCPCGRFKPPSRLNCRLSANIDAVLLRALSQDPDERFASIREFSAAFQAAVRSGPSCHARKLRRLCAALASLLIVAGLVVATWADREKPASNPAPARNPVPASGQDHSESAPFGSTSEVSDSNESSVDYYVELAERHQQSQRFAQAIQCYTQAIALAPDNAVLRVNRAYSLWKSMLLPEAIKDLQQALELDPQMAGPRTQLGLIQIQLGDYRSAKVVLDEEILRHPHEARAFAYRGRAQHRLGQYGAARSDLDSALVLDANCGEGYQFRALLNQDRREARYLDALSDFRECVRCMPDNPYAYSLLASFLSTSPERSLRDGTEARQLATQACELSNWKEPQALRALAAAHAELHQWDDAVSWCQQAFEHAQLHEKTALQRQVEWYRARKSSTENTQ